MSSKDWISSHDGTKLYIENHPVSAPKHVVVLVHGFAEHIGRYGEIFKRLNRAGMSVLGVDLRGHGRSHGMRGYINNISDYVDDLDAAVREAKARNNASTVVILAHSMGALVASCYTAQYPNQVSGLILSSPLIEIAVEIPAWKRKAGHWMAKLMPSFSLKSTMDTKYLTHDTEIVRAYDKDPLVFHYVRAGWFDQITGFKDEAFKTAKKIKTPVLIQFSPEDYVVNYETGHAWASEIRSPNKQILVYDGFYHEIYNEIEREKPISDLIHWLNTHPK
jgi:alpha-beta hydrolase superfamily lysophospholipase